MSGCDSIRDDLPHYAAAVLESDRMRTVERHLQECADCRAEHELLVVLRTPLQAPAGLEARVRHAVAAAPARRRRIHGRAVLAAGIAAAAVTGTLLVTRDTDDPVVAATGVDPVGLGWATRTDPLLHGGPGLEQLSDEELEQLLEEMQS